MYERTWNISKSGTFFLNQGAEVFAEYQELIKKEPDNPVYILVANNKIPIASSRAAYEKILAISPDWAWAHYARAMLIRGAEPARAAAELLQCVEKDPHAEIAFQTLIELQEKTLKRQDEALRTAEKYAAQNDLRPQRLVTLWRLRLAQSGQATGAIQNLRTDLAKIVSDSRDYWTLVAARDAYKELLKDKAGIDATEKKILQVDPAWFPERGRAVSGLMPNHSVAPGYLFYFVNRQVRFYNKVMDVRKNAAPDEQTLQLEKMLGQTADQTMRHIIMDQIFKVAVQTGDAQSALKYSLILREIDPDDFGLLSQTALTLSERKINLTQALSDAQAAVKATTEFRAPKIVGAFKEDREGEVYRQQRALAMDALGWTLFQAGHKGEAEPWLRQSVDTYRDERALKHLASALRETGRADEAVKLISEAETLFTEAVRKKMVNQKVDDFRLASTSGRQYSLESLKGKVVLLNFWATWCGPCLHEMPFMQGLYNKYKDKGIEILSVSIDEYDFRVPPVVTRLKLDFPVFVEPVFGERFNAKTIPLNIFIDRQGTLRYRKIGFDNDSEREFETILAELLKP